jgi:aldehyde:ferredoxin oxidoreductase
MAGRGQILRIDLTTGSISKGAIPEDVARKFLGGEGINSWLLWEHFLQVDPRIDPASPDNVLIAGVGPLGGTGYGAGTKMKWTFKSPRTKMFGDSSSGGAFGANLRWAGYDHVVIIGKSDHPVYLWVDDDDVEIRDAHHLWGMDVEATDHAIKEELGRDDVETACIGQSGENRVGFATLQVSRHRSAGRSGAGCVFGSKNLKAIAVRGTQGIRLHDPQRFLESIKSLAAALNQVQRLRDAWKNAGTLGVFGYYNSSWISPYRNNQYSAVPRDKAEKLSSRWYTENLALRPLSCSPGCISGCSGTYRIKGHESPAAQEYAGETGHKIELAAQIGWGGMCDIADMPALSHLWKICGSYGIDAIELAMCCSFLMELWQRKIIDEKDTAEWFGEPLTLEWGNYKAVSKVIESIALQKNKLGEIFKDGIDTGAQRIADIKHVPVMQYVVHGKGGLPFITEVRSNPSWGIAVAVASRGADHLKGAVATLERFSRPDLSTHHYGSPEAAEFSTPTLKGRDCARAENRCAVINSLGLCTFLVAMDTMLYPADLFAEALIAATGVQVTPQDIEAAGARTVNLEKAFNSRLGLRRQDDRLCARWMDEPQADGPAKGAKARDFLEPMKDEYYEAHGWDKNTSLQTRRRLEELDMRDVAAALAKEDALVP